ncbi:MAG: hypothetical protein J6H31_16790 [Butyrivibrio sp.]|nr:hypothetical protein [Butyrivibrio sp.]
MIKTFIWGFDDIIARKAIFNLIKNGQIDLKKWFVGEHYKREFADIDCAEYFFDEFVNNYSDLNLQVVPIDVEEYIEKHARILAISFSRDMYFYGKPFYELQNMIHIVTRYYYTLLYQYEAELIMFGDVPHGGWMLLLYYVAEALGIRTLICSHTRLENRFVYMFSLDDYGLYKGVPEYDSSEIDFHIEQKIENDWFDMDEAWLDEARHAGVKRKLRALLETRKWLDERRDIIGANRLKYGTFERMVQKKLVEKIGRHIERNNYKEAYKKNVLENVDYNRPYVYYPLHLQPEMTTDTLGGIYCNQLLLLEHLSKLIPDDWVIYAKEHPLQTEYMRGEYFFKQLALLPKVHLVSNKIDTYELNRHSQFVATLVGTTGWEAISGGKNALVFGKAWYGALPGVFHYHEGITLDEIMNYKIDHGEFEKAVAKMMKKMGTGIISNDSIPSVKNFDLDKNNKYIYDFLTFILSYIEKGDDVTIANCVR